MAELVWPLTLPQIALFDGYADQLPDNTVRGSMDVGPAKTRRRGTAGVGDVTVQYRLTPAMRVVFDSFYKIVGGSLRFTWPGPSGDQALAVRIVPRPKCQPRGGGNWTLTLQLEILP
jgi:hypothetical protein